MSHRNHYFIFILYTILLSCPAFGADSGQSPDIEAKADRIIHQMSDYMDTLQQFTCHVENSIDTVLISGQKLQWGRNVDIFIRRPDRLRVNINSYDLSQEIYYDGKTITLFGKEEKYYATMEAPPTIEAAMDHALQSTDLVAPCAELIYRDSYGIMTENVRSGKYVGRSSVFGVECHHLAFRGPEVDWQIWVENSKTPFPRKFVITTKWVSSAPQFTAYFTWDIEPDFQGSIFKFKPPNGAEKIEFLPTR